MIGFKGTVQWAVKTFLEIRKILRISLSCFVRRKAQDFRIPVIIVQIRVAQIFLFPQAADCKTAISAISGN